MPTTPTSGRKLGPLDEFWSLLVRSLGNLAPWQGRMFLQYIFTTQAVPQGKPGGRSMMGKILSDQKGPGTGGLTYKRIIGKLAGIASGSIQTRWQDKAQKSGWLQNIMASETKKVAQSGTEVTGGMQNAIANQVLQGNTAPPGWKGVTSLMYARAKFGSFSNPFMTPDGFAKAVVGGSPKSEGTALEMAKWGAKSLEDWDAIGPIAANTLLQQSIESRRKYEAERRTRRGTSGAETLLMGLVPKLLPQAVGGTLFAGGAEIAKAAGPERSFLYGLGDVTQSLGAEMFASGAGYYPEYSGMGLDPKRYDPTNIQRWEGPRTGAGRAITGAGQGFRQLTGGQPQMPFYDPEEERRKEEERKRLQELMTPYRWDEEPWRFRSSPYWGQR